MNYNDLFSKSFPKELTLTFMTASGTTLATLTNENICQESMTLEGALCSDEDIRYGACEADCFRIRIAPTSNIYFEGSYLRVTMDIAGASSGNLIDAEGNTLVDSEGDAISYYNSTDKVSITIGTYKVLSDMPTADRAWRDLTCYDLMYDIINADVTDWYKGLTFPMTLGDLREGLLTYLSIPFDSQTLINDDLEIKGSFAPDGALSAKTILEAAGELNGVFGHINGHTGKFEWISLLSGNGGSYPTEFDPATMTELKWYVDGSFTHERFEVAPLTGIIVYGEDGDIGDEYIRQDYGGVLHPDAENTNPYVIKGNPLTFGLEGTEELYQALGRLCGAIQDNVYVPYSIKTYGNPMMPLGRRIWVTDTRDNLYMTYVMKRYMTGIQMLMDEYSATGHKQRQLITNSLASNVKRLNNNGLVVKGESFTTTIKPDINEVTCNVSQLNSTNFPTITIPDKNIAFQNLSSYVYMEGVPSGEPEVGINKQLHTFNTQLSVSEQYWSFDDDSTRRKLGVLTGLHYPMVNYAQFISDGGYIGDDGFLYAGTGHEVIEYLYIDGNYLRQMEMSCVSRGYNEEIPIVAYGRPEDFKRAFYTGFDILVCEGSGVPIAISPSISYGTSDVYDWNNKWGGTTPELRETIKNTRTNKELALCSNINVATTATSYNLSESYRNYNMLNISVKSYNNNVLSTQMVTTDYFYHTGSGGRPIIPVFTANGSFLGSVEVYKNTDTSVYVKVSSGNTLTANHRLQIVGIDKK
jgi:hypothetical protein